MEIPKIYIEDLELARAVVTLRKNRESRSEQDDAMQKTFAVIEAVLSEAARKHNCPVCGTQQIMYVILTKE